MKFHLNSFNGCQLTEWTRNSIANDQREITPKLSEAELWFLCMTHRLIALYKCMKFHLNSFNGCQLTEWTRNSIANDQREITPKLSEAELWLLCMTHCLIVLCNCMNFHLNSFKGCQFTEWKRNSIANDQREITPKLSEAELWFLCMTHRLIALYKCMKFHLNSFNGCQLTEWTRNSIANDQREITPKLSEAELWLLCMTHCLIVLCNCMNFHLNSFKGCQFTEWKRNSIANDQREITPKLSEAELWFLCMTHRLIALYKCMKFHLNSFNGCQLTEWTRNSIANDQREITPKLSEAELWLLCMTYCLIVLCNCMNFHLISFKGCQFTEWKRNSIANDQREITPKLSEAELWFLCMTHRLIALYKCMKFHLNSFNGCQLTERTRNSIAI